MNTTMTDAADIALAALVTPGLVEPGFYLASARAALATQLQTKLVDLLLEESRCPASRGRSSIGQLIWIDSAGLFDADRLESAAIEQGADPARVARAVRVLRPSSAAQLTQSLSAVPNATFLQSREPRNRRWEIAPPPDRAPLWRTPLLVISDVVGLFSGPSISGEALSRHFGEFVERLSELKRRAIIIGLHFEEAVPLERRHLSSVMRSLATAVVSWDSSDERRLGHFESSWSPGWRDPLAQLVFPRRAAVGC